MKNALIHRTQITRRYPVFLLILLICLAGWLQQVAATTQYPPAGVSAAAVLNTGSMLPGIRVSWGGATSATGYKVYRADTATGTYRLLTTINSATVRSYTDYSITVNRFYWYKVVSFHKHLLVTHSSALSSSARAMYVTVARISLSQTSARLYEDQSVKLTAQTVGAVAPYRTTAGKIIFRSSNTAVATVDTAGNVKTIKPGTADITASCTDANFRTVTSVCRITVFESMQSPIKPGTYVVTSEYGPRTAIQTSSGTSSSFHAGIDLATRGKAVNIYAVKTGVVTATGYDSSSGNYVLIYHGDEGLYSFYGHLSRIYVKKGASVTKNTVIGLTGTTGISSGIHLHFAISRTTRYWTKEDTINPRNYIRFA